MKAKLDKGNLFAGLGGLWIFSSGMYLLDKAGAINNNQGLMLIIVAAYVFAKLFPAWEFTDDNNEENNND
jgi:hypothetical protein